MNAFDREKLVNATKVYLSQEDGTDNSCYEIRIKLPDGDYATIDLTNDLPARLVYRNTFKDGGFRLTEKQASVVTDYGKVAALRILRSSVGYMNNNPETMEEIISLIANMPNLYPH